jgi:hypothetical protein
MGVGHGYEDEAHVPFFSSFSFYLQQQQPPHPNRM